MRPVFLRTPAHTRTQLFIVMLAFRLRRELEAAWRDLNITVQEGFGQLGTLYAREVGFESSSDGGGGCLSIPEPRPVLAKLSAACDVTAPTALPRRKATVATKRKLP